MSCNCRTPARFLTESVKQGTPVWEYLPFDNLERWPSIQVGSQITFDDPAPHLIRSILQLELYGPDSVMHAALRPEPIGQAMEVALPDRFHHHEHGALHDTIPKTRDTQWPLLAVGFRDVDAPCR